MDDHSTMMIVLQTECVDRWTATSDRPLTVTDAAWNQAMESHSLFCDFILEQDVGMIRNPQDQVQHWIQQPLNPCGLDNSLFLVHPSSLLPDEDHTTAQSRVPGTAATTVHLSFTNCRLRLTDRESNLLLFHPSDTVLTCPTDENADTHGTACDETVDHVHFRPANQQNATHATHQHNPNLYLPVTPFPEEFSWTTTSSPEVSLAVYLLQLDLSEAKALFLLDWQEQRQSSARGDESEPAHAAPAGLAPTMLDEPAWTANDSDPPLQQHQQQPVEDASSTQAAGPTPTPSTSTPMSSTTNEPPRLLDESLIWRYKQLVRQQQQQALHDRRHNNRVADIPEGLQVTMMMERELAGLNSILYVMALLGGVLTVFLIWTARQIVLENKLKQEMRQRHRLHSAGSSKSHRLSSKTTTSHGPMMLDIPASVTVRVDEQPQRHERNLETDSPLSMDTALDDDGGGDDDNNNNNKRNTAGENDSNVSSRFTETIPCASPNLSPIASSTSASDMHAHWWKSRMAVIADEDSCDSEDDLNEEDEDDGNENEQNDHDGDVQCIKSHCPSTSPVHEDDSKRGIQSNYYSRNTVCKDAVVTPRRIVLAESATKAATSTTAAAAAAAAAAVTKATLQTRIEPCKVLLSNEPKAKQGTPSMAPSHTSSFIEDYW